PVALEGSALAVGFEVYRHSVVSSANRFNPLREANLNRWKASKVLDEIALEFMLIDEMAFGKSVSLWACTDRRKACPVIVVISSPVRNHRVAQESRGSETSQRARTFIVQDYCARMRHGVRIPLENDRLDSGL